MAIKRILLAIGLIFILLSVTSFITQGNAWLPLMALLGATIGIPMGLLYPFPLLTKISMLIGLVLSMAAIGYGVKTRERIAGQVSAVVGFIGWSLIGLMGLGTGT